MPNTGKWMAGGARKHAVATVAAVVAVVLLAFAPSALADDPEVDPLAPAAPNPGPSVSGTEVDGQTLTGTTGTWSGFPAPSFSYEWFRCDAVGTACDNDPVAGRTAITYLLGPSDIGRRLKIRVRGQGALGAREVDSETTGVIQALPPSNTSVPVISGTPRAGEMLSTTDGAWTGTPPLTFTRQWQRCDSTGSSCANISGATGSSYTATRADMASTLRVRVTADNPAPGTVSALSNATSQVDGIPVNSTAPVLSGSPRTGQTLSGTDGAWTGFPAPAFTYQWVRCDSAGANCADVGGATSSSYTLGAPDDIDKRLKLRVTATNSVGAVSEESALSAAVVDPPANTELPVVSGTEEVGQTLNATNGTWTGTPTPTFARQWFRCNSAGSGCTTIAGATSLSYALVSADAGRKLKLRVTASNSGGAAPPATSALTGVIKGPPIARLDISSGSPQTGERVIFDSSTSGDPDEGALTVLWDFDGDGFDDGTAARIGHTFTSAGTKTIRLRVTDDEGDVDETSGSVRVSAPPVVAPVPPPRFDLPDPVTPTPTTPPEPAQPAFIRPFPVVRISGRATRRGARIRLLAVRAPRGSLVRVRCKGGKRRGCKYRRASKRVGRSGRVRIRGVQRRLRARAVIEISVTRRGEIGKFTRFRIRRRKAPLRRDLCVPPGSRKPTKCGAL